MDAVEKANMRKDKNNGQRERIKWEIGEWKEALRDQSKSKSKAKKEDK